MLNKKSLFHFVYAIALVGAIMACIGILNEFLSIAQLHGVAINNTITLKKESYFEPFFFYLLAFLVSAGAVAVLLLHLFEIVKLDRKTVNIILLSACGVLLVMSFVFLYFLGYHYKWTDYFSKETGESYRIEYFNYIIYYTFRTAVMSFLANMGVVLACHLIDGKCNKAKEPEQAKDPE